MKIGVSVVEKRFITLAKDMLFCLRIDVYSFLMSVYILGEFRFIFLVKISRFSLFG